jgi:hypothetical protein
VLVDEDEVQAWGNDNQQPFNRDAYLGLYADTCHGTAGEPLNGLIRRYAATVCPRPAITTRSLRWACYATNYSAGMISSF